MKNESLDEAIDRVAAAMTVVSGDATASARVRRRLDARSAAGLPLVAVAATLALVVAVGLTMWRWPGGGGVPSRAGLTGRNMLLMVPLRESIGANVDRSESVGQPHLARRGPAHEAIAVAQPAAGSEAEAQVTALVIDALEVVPLRIPEGPEIVSLHIAPLQVPELEASQPTKEMK